MDMTWKTGPAKRPGTYVVCRGGNYGLRRVRAAGEEFGAMYESLGPLDGWLEALLRRIYHEAYGPHSVKALFGDLPSEGRAKQERNRVRPIR